MSATQDIFQDHGRHLKSGAWQERSTKPGSHSVTGQKQSVLNGLFTAPPGQDSLLVRYGVALVAAGTALVIDLLTKSTLGETATGLFIVAAMISSWYGGIGPGVASIVAADLFNIVFFYNPHFSLSLGVHGLERILLFSMVGLLVSWLTSRKRRAETELKHFNELLESRVAMRTAALQESNNQLEEFCQTLAHDLRAPLRAMQGFASLLQEDYAAQLDESGRDYAHRITTSAERMGELILDLLAYSHLSRSEYRLEKINLPRMMDKALESLASEIQIRKAIITRDLPPLSVIGDRATIENAITNLLTNSLKFSKPDVIPRIHIGSEKHLDRVRLWVADNGIGIAPEYQSRIFGVFERLHQFGAYPGTGIGLAMVKKGVERMGGSVGVESLPGEGSRFWIELPTG